MKSPIVSTACCLIVAMLPRPLLATDIYWDGGAGTAAWGSSAGANNNWSSNFTPEAAFAERAVVGTDGAAGLLAGVTEITAGAPNVGGIALGLREVDTFGDYVNPAPAPGALTGQVSISGGTVNSVRTGQASFGADGRVLLGVEGRGYLTMTGGTLRTPALVVDGEDDDSGLGHSTLTLGGAATLEVSNAHQAAPNNVPDAAINTTTIARNLQIEGPGVNFTTFGRVTLEATSQYTAVITNSTMHSPIRTGNIAVVSGGLHVQFSGAGTTHAIGTTWDLVDADIAIAGTFSGLGEGGAVEVSGLPGAVPLGAAYRVQKVGTPGSGQTLQLAYDRVLVLQVNRDTGEMSIRSPQGGTIGITGYTVKSGRGSLLTSYAGISGTLPTPPDAGWSKPVDDSSQPLNTVNALTEVKQPDFTPPITDLDFGVTSTAVSLGTGFSRTGVGANVANFGQTGEDLVFEYETLDGVLRGQVEYVGTTFQNNLVLRVNPNTGQAFLKNDSLETLVIDGYSITSDTDALSGAGWTGIGGAWEKTPASTAALSETNPVGSTTLAPNAEVAIGDIGAFAAAADQDGLGLKFALAVGLEGTGGSLDGDFNGDSDVDGSDFLLWQRGGSPNGATAGDLALWQGSYGGGGGGANPPETEFRIGTVVFDATAGVAAGASVPEPATVLLWGVAALALAASRRGRFARWLFASSAPDQPLLSQFRGADVMTCPLRVARWFCVALAAAAGPAGGEVLATTQNIPLVNNHFELPGPEGVKTVAFDETGAPIAGLIPGWTFSGPGVEDFGDGVPGDSGVEGGGNPGNEMLLSTKDGVVYQTAAGFTLEAIPATQEYAFTFDAHEIFAQSDDGSIGYTGQELSQLTTRFYYGAARTTLTTLVVNPPTAVTRYEVIIPSNSPLLSAPALGQPIGVEFDTTSIEFNGFSLRSWIGVDDVLMQIRGVLEGDLDGDGDIDLMDYRRIRDHLEQPFDALADGDVNADGFVDLNDFRAWKSIPAVASSGVLSLIAVPEPSSLALVAGALAVAVAGGWRRGTSRRLLVALAAAAGLLGAQSARAELLLYDPFIIGATPANGEYAEGQLADLNGGGVSQNPTIGPASPSFLTGPWSTFTDDVVAATVQPTGLSFLGSPAAGGAVTSNGGASRPYRELATPWDATTSGTFYMSYLMSFGASPEGTTRDDVGHRVVEMWSADGTPGDDSAIVARIGYMSYNGNFNSLPPDEAPLKFGLGFGTEVPVLGGPASFAEDNGATHLIVLKFVLSDQDAMDSVEMFLDPTDNDEPVVASASFFNQDFTLGSISGPIQFAGSGTPAVFDELRVGTTYVDVLPDFPLKGDTNGDDAVDILDYQAIYSHLNLTGQSTANGDVTGDGRVDLRDIALWRANRTDLGATVASGGFVPEPAAWALAFVAAAALGWRRRSGN